MMEPIRIVLFDDQKERRERLCACMKATERFICVGTVSRRDELVYLLRTNPVDVVVVDIDSPGREPVEIVRLVKQEMPVVKILVQTVFENDGEIIDCIRAGADGYLFKGTADQKILDAIDDVVQGGAFMTPAIAKRVLDIFSDNLAVHSRADYKLTEREAEILHDLVGGLSYKMIAQTRSISVYTVNAHVRNLYHKLKVHSVAEAVAKALKQGIV